MPEGKAGARFAARQPSRRQMAANATAPQLLCVCVSRNRSSTVSGASEDSSSTM